MQRSSEIPTDTERMYRCLRNAVSDYHYHVRVEDGRIVQKIHGATCEQITGFTPEEFAANPDLWIAIVLDEDQQIFQQQTAELLSGHPPHPIEYRIRRKDCRIRWINKIVVPHYDNQGKLIAYDSLLRDITEQKKVETDLRRSEEQFRFLFEDDLTGNYLADPNGEIILCNQAFVEIFGFTSREEAIGSNLANLYLGPLSWPSFIQLLTNDKTLQRVERAGRHSDGTIRHVIETVLGTFNTSDELIRIKGYIFDDTNSKLSSARLERQTKELAELVSLRTQELRDKHEHLQAIWNSAFDAIFTIDSLGVIETVNRAAERMFGYSATEMIGANVKMLMPRPYSEEHDGYIQRYRNTGEARILNLPRELIAKHKNGSTFPIDLSVTQVENSAYFTGIIRDISDRKRLQRHILEIASEEQRRIGRELHDGTGQELTGLSLTTGTLLEMLDMTPVDIVDGHTLRQLDETAFTRIRDMVVKTYRKLIEANRHVHELSHGIMPVQIDAEALRSSLSELAASTNNPPTIRCRFDCPMPIAISSNSVATHLYRIAQEAVNNAIKHSQANEIVISLHQHDQEIVLEILDDGVGIDAAYSQIVAARKDHGMGMRTMQYRAGIIGGTLQIQRRDAGGTAIKCVTLQPIERDSYDKT